MFKTKNMFAVLLLVFAVCISVAVAGCGEKEQQHTHTYSEEWTRSETEHWHEATCEHTDEKGDLGAHIDEDNDGKCDKCDYTMQQPELPPHTHTFDESHWEHDENTHWHAATCGCDDQKGDEAPHVDEDENQFCDVCGEFIEHVHKFSETEWAFNKTEHWRPATCTHKTEKGNVTEHVFSDGECECGLKQDEVDAFNGLVEYGVISEDDTDFYSWLTDLKADGVTGIHKTVKGDIIYSLNGKTEAFYVAERTVKVKASVDGDGLADVWFKVAMSEKGTYHIVNDNVDALAVAKTGADGVAELTFKPIGGYSDGENIKYEILLAEAKDIEVLIGTEEKDVKIIPNRYSIKLDDEEVESGKGVVTDFEVSETDTTGEDITGILEFKYDVSWAASDKQMLPYERRYDDEVAGTGGPKEYGKEYNFTATGGKIFDYMLFSPAHGYDWSAGNTTEDFDAISANYRKSASGEYEISFTVTGGGSARLYYWDGIDLSIAQKEADGSPSHEYVKSVSGTKPEGSDIDDKAFTGENKVLVTIKPENGLSEFQLGIVCQDKCQVTITVKRLGDYVAIESGGVLTVGENTNNGEGYTILGYDDNNGITAFTLQDVEPGLYYLTVGTGKTIGAYKAYCRSSEKTILYEDGKYKGVIRVNEGDTTLYLQYGLKLNHKTSEILLEQYTAPTVGLRTSWIPASGITRTADSKPIEEYEIGFDETVTPGHYRMEISTFGYETGFFGGSGVDGCKAVIKIGGRTYQTSLHNKYMIDQTGVLANECEYYAAVIDIKEGEKFNLHVTTPDIQGFTAKVKLVAYDGVAVGDIITIDMDTISSSTQVSRYTFNAQSAGTYKITLNLVESYEHNNTQMPNKYSDGDVSFLDVKDETHNSMIITHTRDGRNIGRPLDNPVQTVSGTFEMQEGESIIFAISNKLPGGDALMKFSFTLAFVE